MKCPICGSKELLWSKLESNKIDGSYLYKDIVILSCWSCRNHFNKLTRHEKRNLEYYYSKEYHDSIYTPTERNGIDFKLLGLINNHDYDINVNRIDFLEHCWNIKTAVKNIKKLNKFTLIVPDSERYNDNYFWIIKEHVYHFNYNGIAELFKGFKILSSKKTVQKLLNGKLFIPIIEFEMQKDESLNGIYYYGISREFLQKWDGKADGLIDETPGKIGHTIKGIKIQSPDIITLLDSDTTIIISSRFWYKEIEKKIKGKGFKGKCLRMFS
jgi:hypothetical protein